MSDLEIIKKINDDLYITHNINSVYCFYFYSLTGDADSNFLYYSTDFVTKLAIWADPVNHDGMGEWEDVSNNFQDVHNPTQNELTMFQLKYGIDLTYMLEYMKNDGLCENNTEIKTS